MNYTNFGFGTLIINLYNISAVLCIYKYNSFKYDLGILQDKENKVYGTENISYRVQNKTHDFG